MRDFGVFEVKTRASRIGRNPKTGERVDVPAKRVPFFKPSKELKDLVNHSADGSAPAPAATEHAPAPAAGGNPGPVL